MKIRLLLICMGTSLVCCTVKKNEHFKDYQLLDIQYKHEKAQRELLQDAIIKSIEISNTKLPDSLSFIDCVGDTVFLRNYLSNTKALILYTGTSFCSSCFQSELVKLSQYVDQSNRKILVLIQNMSFRDLLIIKKRNEYKFDIGIINNISGYKIRIFEDDEPIYFTVDSKLILSDIFVPFKNMDKLSQRYFQSVLRKR